MSSTGSSIEGGLKYKRLPRPKEQKTFSSKRRTTRPQTSTASLSKRQSTLTQQWEVNTPRPVIDISSGDEDDEYTERPAKRQRMSTSKGRKPKFDEREEDQRTYTQFATGRRQRTEFDLDADDFQVWQDSQAEGEGERSSPAPAADARGTAPGKGCEELENESPEIAESSQHHWYEPQPNSPKGRRVDTKATMKVRTPQKVRFVEVPSSRAPPSTRQTISRLNQARQSTTRSPLKERSANVSSPVKRPESPESQNMSLKMLERVHFARQRRAKEERMAKEHLDEDVLQCAAEATAPLSLGTYRMPPPPIKRITTVQDSQAEDFDEMRSPLYHSPPGLTRTGTIPDSQRNSSNETLAEDSQSQRPRRKLRRISTVQDSECDDSDMELENEAATIQTSQAAASMKDVDDGNDDYQSSHFPEGTYDPAFSALDRDATRFNWTQTQLGQSSHVEDSETEDEGDLDRGFQVNRSRSFEIPSDDVPSRMDEPTSGKTGLSPDDDVDNGVPSREEAPRTAKQKEARLQGDSAYESGHKQTASSQSRANNPSSQPDVHEESENVEVPSSPPPLRPSQVSTVVPTQASMAMPAPSPRRKIKAEPMTQQISQPFSLLSSPHKASSMWEPESLSSSPLPLPPWSSPEKHRLEEPGRTGRDINELGSDAQLDSLADFSLPPPPPLSSSRRQTPASSSL